MENDLIGPAFPGVAGDGDAALAGTLDLVTEGITCRNRHALAAQCHNDHFGDVAFWPRTSRISPCYQCSGSCTGHDREARGEVDHSTFVYIGDANARGVRLLS
jgi:hypothetical protein